jgi:glycosyltransferase involved in cell wall biosynthesis
LRVSVLIDTYNHEQFIAQAINSVLDQDMPLADVEIVVVDDGSTDRTPEIVRGFEPRIRSIRKPNGGQASAFNTGVSECHGEIIAFLDGDDWWEKTKLRLVLEAFEKRPEIGAVGNGLYEVDARGKRQYINVPDRSYRIFFHTLEEGIWFRELMSFMGTSRLAIRKSVLETILPVPNELVIEADEYLATLAVAVSGALVLDQALTNYRFHAGNLYQYGAFNLEKARRKARVLTYLARELPVRLQALGISREIADAALGSRNLEAERFRLTVEGGKPWETFRAEREAYRMAYAGFSPGYWLFQSMVLALTLVMPPRIFYRLRNWYADRRLHRFRQMLGKATPNQTLVERRVAG